MASLPAAAERSEAGAPDIAEIEITPEMIEAGAAEVAAYSPETGTAQDAALAVFQAMLAARPPVIAGSREQKDRLSALGEAP